MVKHVLFTAPESYHARLHEAFDKHPLCGFRPMFMPLISSVLLPPESMFLTLCSELASYDYVICSSIMAVRALQTAGLDSSLLAGKVVAIGNDQQAVSQLLGVPAALSDAKPSMMGVVEALACLPSLSAKRIAVLLPKFCGMPVPATITQFQQALDRTGATISYVYCYRTAALSEEYYAETVDALRSGTISAIAITSGGEAYVLSKILAYAAAQGEPICVPIYSFGPYTTHCAEQVSLPIAGTSPKHQRFTDFIDYLDSQQ